MTVYFEDNVLNKDDCGSDTTGQCDVNLAQACWVKHGQQSVSLKVHANSNCQP